MSTKQPYCVNGYVAVAPFRKDLEVRHNEAARIAGIRQRNELARTTVVYGSERCPAGATVYLKGDAHAGHDGKLILEVETGRPFVLIPEAWVQMVFPPGAASGEQGVA